MSAAPFTPHADATHSLQEDAGGTNSAVVSGEEPVVFTLPVHSRGGCYRAAVGAWNSNIQ